jgi:tRNA(adenine34) deaminase
MSRAQDHEWLQKALVLAKLAASQDEVPVGAVIVREGQIIGQGFNQREQSHNPLAHAELLAIQDAAHRLRSWRLIGCVLYSTLEPCPMCLAGSQQARLGEVVYGAQDPKGGALSLGYLIHEDVRTNHRFAVRHSEESQCGQILKDFFKKKRNSKGDSFL